MRAVLDWELCTLGDVLNDLAQLLDGQDTGLRLGRGAGDAAEDANVGPGGDGSGGFNPQPAGNDATTVDGRPWVSGRGWQERWLWPERLWQPRRQQA